ncbi:MAG TPA: hypothetical protein VHO28_04755 [Ignavibacteriales bacterium]|nr:hypothetical protein [Ignavibacteriales bacterium]
MKNLIAFSMLLFLLSGCSMFEEDEQPSEYGKIAFFVTSSSQDDTRPHMDLYLQTEKIYNSAGFKIDIDKKFSGDALVINIIGIIDADSSISEPGKASAYINILDYKGAWKLVIKGENFNDVYFVVFESNRFMIHGPATSHTEPISRVPL